MCNLSFNNIQREISKIICQVTGIKPEDLKYDAHLYHDIGIDSIKGIELTVALQEKFSIQIDDYKIPELTTVALIAKEVKRLLNK